MYLTDRELEFVTFVIGSVAERMQTSADNVYRLLDKAGIIRGYIVPAYNVLHTFSREYIVDDIIDFMKEKGVYPC